MPTRPFLGALLKKVPVSYALPVLFVAAVVLASFAMPVPTSIGSSLAACTSAGISAAPPSPHVASGTVVVTGTGTCTADAYGGTGIAVFRFWVKPPGGSWTVVQGYSTTNTYNWNISGLAAGIYGLEVDVNSTGSTVDHERAANTTYTILVVPACGSAGASTLTSAPPSPGPTGTTVTFTATTTGCPTPNYRFWVSNPGAPWIIVQDYSPTNTFVWKTPATGLKGIYRIEADFRDASSSIDHDAAANTTYTLNACTVAGLTASPPSPAYAPGQSGGITLTGTSTCPGTATYKFWVLPPGGSWTVLRDYLTSNTYSWNVLSLPAGTYGLEVDVRDQGATDTYEVVHNIQYVLNVPPCLTATLTAAPPAPGPAATGSTVTLTGSSTGCQNPVYRFWVRQNGIWTIVRDYAFSNVFSWTTPGTGLAGTYGLEVDVRDNIGTADHDVAANATYVLNGCSAAGLTAAPSATQVHGNAVLLTGTATCPGTPTYRFWIRLSGGAWTIVRDYQTTNTFSYTPPVAGTYFFEVDVRDQGGTDTYEKVSNINNYPVT
ncbi:MAG TPA: hypothetical protein VGU71_16005 [Candidatus Dormibacteraeota bacterium]|nr:hypothetical protein [Candidatus Dormibacteraeota bacterium]